MARSGRPGAACGGRHEPAPRRPRPAPATGHSSLLTSFISHRPAQIGHGAPIRRQCLLVLELRPVVRAWAWRRSFRSAASSLYLFAGHPKLLLWLPHSPSAPPARAARPRSTCGSSLPPRSRPANCVCCAPLCACSTALAFSATLLARRPQSKGSQLTTDARHGDVPRQHLEVVEAACSARTGSGRDVVGLGDAPLVFRLLVPRTAPAGSRAGSPRRAGGRPRARGGALAAARGSARPGTVSSRSRPSRSLSSSRWVASRFSAAESS